MPDALGLGEGRDVGAARVRACLWAALALMFAYRISTNVADLDLFHQMALAREAIAAGALLDHDVYAFTPTHEHLVHHEWAAGMIAYAVATTAGATGIVALNYALALAAAFVAIRAGTRRPGTRDVVWALVPVALVLADHGFSPVRAQAYSFLLAAVTLWCVERDREGDRRWMGPYALAFVVWVNLHGGFVVGPALLAAHALEQGLRRRPWRHLALLLLALAVLGLANPYGPALYASVARAVTMSRPFVAEWAPLWSPVAPSYHQAAFALSVALAGGLLVSRGRWRGADGVLLLAVVAAAAVQHQRMLPFYAVAWLAIVPGWLAGTELGDTLARFPGRWPRRMLVVSGAVALLFGAMWVGRDPVFLRVPNEPPSGGSGLSYPVGAVRFLEAARFRGTLLTPFEHGAFVSWKLYPDVKVSLDSRYEAAYPDAVVDEILRAYFTGERLEQVLEKYGADLVLVPAQATRARLALSWPIVYEDRGFALHARPGLRVEAPARLPERLDEPFP